MVRILLIIAILLSLQAQAQFGQHLLLKPTSTSGGGSFTGILDGVSNVQVAYSLRRLNTGYTGPVAKVRRSSDNTTLDIGTETDGDFDATAFTAFVGAGIGYVDIMYDQSGNGKSATPITSAEAPRIILNAHGGHAAVYFQGSDGLKIDGTGSSTYLLPLQNGQGTINVVVMLEYAADPNNIYNLISNTGASSTQRGFGLFYDDRSSVPRNNGLLTLVNNGTGGQTVVNDYQGDVVAPNTWYTLHAMVNNTASGTARSQRWVGATALSQNNTGANAATSTSPASNVIIGNHTSLATTANFKGYMGDIIIYSVQISEALRTAVTADQTSYYGL